MLAIDSRRLTFIASSLAKFYNPANPFIPAVRLVPMITLTNSITTAQYRRMSCCRVKLDRAIAIALSMIELRKASNIALKLASQP